MNPRAFLILSLFVFFAASRAAEPFEIKDGDRVLLLGDTLLERENSYGTLELRMHEQFPERKFSVRNLSWAGETPRGISRASFDPPEKGFERLKEQIALVKPTVVFLGFGMAASLQEMTDRAHDWTLNPDPARYGAEPMSAGRFKRELGQLMDAIAEIASKDTAAAQPGGLKEISPGQRPGSPVKSGTRPEGAQERSAAPAGADAKGNGGPRVSPGANVPQPSGLNAGGVRFVLLSPIRHEDLRATRPGLPDPAAHNALLVQYSKAIEELAKERGGRFVDLPNRTNDGQPLTDNGIHRNETGHWLIGMDLMDAFDWKPRNVSPGITAPADAWKEHEGAMKGQDSLRAAILRKNALWFHRTRPANETYLTGFRKHEQGQNAKEIPEFDPLVEAADAEIDRLKRGAKGAQAAPKGPISSPENADSKLESPPVSLTKAPGNLANAPVSLTKAPVSLTKAPVSLTKAPVSLTNAPVSLTKAPVSLTNAPVSLTNAPVILTKAPVSLTNAPVILTKAPVSLTKAPVSLTNAPVSLTNAPGNLPTFDLGENLEITLWAANPLLVKPTQMNWDALGRLWVCGTAHYPQIAPGELEKDQIFILEDTDRDGKADKSTPFAGGMLMPTAIVPDLAFGVGSLAFGVKPAAGAADVRGRDSKSPPVPGAERQTPNAKRQTPNGVRAACYVGASTEILHFADTDGDGVADTKRIVFSGFGTEDTHHNVHTLKWGPYGRLYFNQSVYTHTHLETPYGVVRLNAGGVFAYDPRTERVEVFSKGLWNPWGHVIHRNGQHFLTDGAGRDGISWAFPGAVFAPSEGARQTMGSISPGTYPKFAGLELIHSPHFPDDWQGTAVTCDFRAHRIVRFKINDLGPAKSGYVTADLPEVARTADIAFRPIDVKLGPDGALYIADWTNEVINHGEVDFRDPRRDKQSGRIWRVSYKGRPTVKREPPAIAAPVSDGSPRGRIATMRALARKPTIENASAILAAAVNAPADDPHYAFAAWRSINDVADVWVDAVLKGEWKPEGREKQLEFALKSIEPALAGKVLAQLVASGKAPLDGTGPWFELIGLAGGAKEVRALFDVFAAGKIPTAAEARALNAFVDAARNRNVRPEGELRFMLQWLQSPNADDPARRAAGLRTLGLWKVTHGVEFVAPAARAAKNPPEVRAAAFDALRSYGDAAALRHLDEMTRAEFPLETRRRALVALAQTKLDAGVAKAGEVLRDIKNPDEAVVTWRGLLAIANAPNVFANRMPKDLPQPIYAAALRAAREQGRKAEKLVATLTPLAGATTTAAPADYTDLAAQTLANGDPVAGEEVYRRAGLACTVCHSIGGAGGKVGPELGTIGASAPLDYIIESMLAPGAKVKEGYNAVSLVQKDGNVSMGVIVRESAADIMIRTATGQEQTIAKELVKSKDNLGSIMPLGLVEQLKPREKLNLYAFLAQLGKQGVYDASRGHIARTWWLSETRPMGPMSPMALTNVDGRLPRARLVESLAIFPNAPAVFATAKLTVAAPTKTQLHLAGVREAWLDGKPLAVASEPSPSVELSAGEHTLVVKLDPKSLPEVLRVEAANVRFLTE
ncbi:MAG: HEAT repeat domain-containing protein [Chthoniobacteraceae bacterium]